MIDIIKTILYNDKNKLIDLLEKLGCHKINPNFNNEIRCALPVSLDGQTGTSVQIKLNKYLSTYVYSRSEYENYEIKDIISFVQFLLKCNFKTAINWLCNELDIEYREEEIIIKNQSETIKCINKYKNKNKTEAKNEIMDESILSQFPDFIVKEWIDEGISAKTQKKYDIRIDKRNSMYYGNRWLIPIRDENNNLITIKGRTFLPNYKELDIPKYIYYKKDKNSRLYNNILFGLNYNYKYIKESNEVILFESEKSVMKAEDLGFNNCVAIGKNGINPYIKPKILKLHTNVVLAFDKDIPLKDIIKESKKLSLFTNVYYIYDSKGLLKNKESPVDQGLGVWLELYNNKKRII